MRTSGGYDRHDTGILGTGSHGIEQAFKQPRDQHRSAGGPRFRVDMANWARNVPVAAPHSRAVSAMSHAFNAKSATSLSPGVSPHSPKRVAICSPKAPRAGASRIATAMPPYGSIELSAVGGMSPPPRSWNHHGTPFIAGKMTVLGQIRGLSEEASFGSACLFSATMRYWKPMSLGLPPSATDAVKEPPRPIANGMRLAPSGVRQG